MELLHLKPSNFLDLRYFSEESDDIEDALDEFEEAGQLFEVIECNRM